MAEDRAVSAPPAPVRLEIVGIGEEEMMVELEELVQEEGEVGEEEADVEDREVVAEAPIIGPQERRMRGVAPGERGELAGFI